MDLLVSLRYPNGDSRETTISLPGTVRPGSEFGAFGRRWRVVALDTVGGDDDEDEPVACECIGFDNLTLIGRLNERSEWTGGIA